MPGREWVAVVSLILPLPAAGCGSTGWLPSLTLGVAGIRGISTTETQREVDYRLRAEAHVSWLLQPEAGADSEADAESDETVDEPADSPCAAAELCEWETQERTRALLAANSSRDGQ